MSRYLYEQLRSDVERMLRNANATINDFAPANNAWEAGALEAYTDVQMTLTYILQKAQNAERTRAYIELQYDPEFETLN